MNNTQYLLSKIAEEASEVAVAALKAQQFGLYESYNEVTNLERLVAEINDLMGAMNMFSSENNISNWVSQKQQVEKIRKIERYRRTAMLLRGVEPDHVLLELVDNLDDSYSVNAFHKIGTSIDDSENDTVYDAMQVIAEHRGLEQARYMINLSREYYHSQRISVSTSSRKITDPEPVVGPHGHYTPPKNTPSPSDDKA